MVGDAVVVLARPRHELLLGRLALLGALHPVGLVEGAAGSLQLRSHLVNECLTVKCHAHTLSRVQGTPKYVRSVCQNGLLSEPPSPNQDGSHGYLPSRTRRGPNSRSRALCRLLHRSARFAGGGPRRQPRLPEGLGRAGPPLADPHRRQPLRARARRVQDRVGRRSRRLRDQPRALRLHGRANRAPAPNSVRATRSASTRPPATRWRSTQRWRRSATACRCSIRRRCRWTSSGSPRLVSTTAC